MDSDSLNVRKGDGNDMPQDDEVFKAALIGKKIPILTLDHTWHKLFTQTGDDPQIHKLEEELNELLKRQGKLNSEIKSLNSYKKVLMQEIVSIMELPDSPEKDKKMDENKRLIEESNGKIDEYKDELMDIPKQINDKNMDLMLATMHVCYDKIKKNTQDIDEINKWIQDFRVQLKRKVITKQQKEIYNDELYSYMHNIFGPDVIEMFDLKYNPGNVLNKEKDAANEQQQ